MTIKIVNKLGALPVYKTIDDMEYGDALSRRADQGAVT